MANSPRLSIVWTSIPRAIPSIRMFPTCSPPSGPWARVALVSDIHFDLRADLAQQGIADLIDAYVLSYEHGFQKPDPRIFELALDAVGAQPKEALMIGDRASHDGGAVTAGIPTLLLPAPRDLVQRGLDIVLQMLK